MKKLIYILLFVAASVSSYAQQEGHFTQFMYTQQMINPAYVGSREVPSFTAIYRNQWLDVEGAPQNMLLTFASPFFGDKVGFGLTAFRQQIGAFEQWSGSLAYSYKLQLTESLNLRIGLQGSAYYHTWDVMGSNPTFFDLDDPSIPMSGDIDEQLKGNFGAGLYLYNNTFYFGLSSPHFLSNVIGLNEEVGVTAERTAHYYAMAGAIIPMNEKIKLRPAILGKYEPSSPFQLDVNISAIFNNKLSVGASYRTGSGGNNIGESVDFLMFLQLARKIGFGISYDFTLSDLQDYNNGTFEVMMRFDLRSLRDDLENPRFFL